jgi:hypothetical protein
MVLVGKMVRMVLDMVLDMVLGSKLLVRMVVDMDRSKDCHCSSSLLILKL